MSEDQLLLFLVQMLVVLGLARVLGEVFRRFGQPPLAGEILAGVLLGQTVFGHVAPELFATVFPEDPLQRAIFDVTADIGILFLLLVVGLEVNVAAAWKMRNQTFIVAVTGVLVPLALGTGVAWLLYDAWVELETPRLAFALLVGAGVSITAITVVARLLFDLKIVKSDLGLFLVSAMAINELLGWVVLAVVLGLVGAAHAGVEGGVDVVHLLTVLGGTLLFAAIATTIGRKGVTRALLWVERHRLPTPATPLSIVVCMGLLGGVVTSALGVHPVFGFLLAGLMAGDPKALSEHTRSIIAQMVESIFVPLFFAGICLHVDFAAHFDPMMVLWVTLLSVVGKFAGAGMGTLMVRMPALDRFPTAIAHIPGGPMGVLLATVAKEAGVIGPQMFVALVVASIVSAIAVGPAFDWALRRRPAFNVLRFFAEDRIVPELAAETREAAIDALVAHVARSPGVPPVEEIAEAVHARERTMGTGIGHRIAVPHARFPGLAQPVVVLGISTDGIEWDAVDDQPAHLIFLVLTSAEETDSQLQILSTIARGLSDDEACRNLIHARTAAEAWQCLRPNLVRAAYAGGTSAARG